MIVLVFDTSTPNTTVGWVRFSSNDPEVDPVAFADVFAPAQPGHAEVLLDRISAVLSSGGYGIGDVNLIVHGAGPGTFTGLRIGMSTARAFGISHGIPAVGLSTLRAVAASSGRIGTVVSLIDARRNELYVGAFQVSGVEDKVDATSLMEECVLPVSQVLPALAACGIAAPHVFAGNGGAVYPETLSPAGEILSIARLPLNVLWMARAGLRQFNVNGGDDPQRSEPVYLRAPDAKLPAEPKFHREIIVPE
jgi:tRNA threonylcarbamoyladenosine biosynthesis protein TsaB